MAGAERAAANSVVGALLSDARRYEFYQAVGLLLAAETHATSPGSAPGGLDEIVRFRCNPSFGFPSSDIDSIERSKGPDPGAYRMIVNFMGLCGASSPLPSFYTENLLRADSETDAQRDFYDFFHHRLLSLLYSLWQKYRHHVRHVRGATDDLSILIGGLGRLDDALAMPGLRPRGRAALFPCLGLLLMRSISPYTLARIVSVYFGELPVRIIEGVPRAVSIAREQQCGLGATGSRLDVDCVVGDTVWDVGGKFRIALGPLDFERFRQFLPGRPGLRALRDLVAFAARDMLEYDVELTLMRHETPELALGEECPCELGWSTWLGLPDGDGVVMISTHDLLEPDDITVSADLGLQASERKGSGHRDL